MRNSRPPRTERPQPRPGRVTAIEGQVRDRDRVSVFIDGEFAFGLARDVADLASLAVGDDLDAAAIARLLDQEARHAAMATALNYLAYRPRSEGEVRTRLQRAGYGDGVVEEVMERLRGWRYVDDDEFARRWVENRSLHRPRGSRLLQQELRTKGVDPVTAGEAIAEAGLDEMADALALARKRAARLSDLEPPVRERRISGLLSRRGYDFDVIRKVIATLRAEAAGEAEPDLDDPAF